MMDSDWIIRIGAHEYRAPNTTTLREWIAAGRIPLSAFARVPETGEWLPISDVPDLRDALPIASQPPAAAPAASSSSFSACAVGCFVILASGLLLIVLSSILSTAKRDSSTRESQPTPPASAVSAGVETLYVEGLDQIAIARTEEAYEKFLQASVRKDQYGYAELAMSGDVFLVANGTRVLVLDYGFMKHQVRILEGPSTGASGWVPREWVQER